MYQSSPHFVNARAMDYQSITAKNDKCTGAMCDKGCFVILRDGVCSGRKCSGIPSRARLLAWCDSRIHGTLPHAHQLHPWYHAECYLRRKQRSLFLIPSFREWNLGIGTTTLTRYSSLSKKRLKDRLYMLVDRYIDTIEYFTITYNMLIFGTAILQGQHRWISVDWYSLIPKTTACRTGGPP